ncbi:hypothetical protein PLESTM_001655400 [Pleodorina starrii]|nr:hypothetical protein PLESTM_001655400 [Pleodorina starrii]
MKGPAWPPTQLGEGATQAQGGVGGGEAEAQTDVAATQQHQQHRPLDNSSFLWAFNKHHGSNVLRRDGIERISQELRCREDDVTTAVNAVLRENGGLCWGQPTEEQAAYIGSVFDQHMSDGYPKETALELTAGDLASNWKPATVVDTLRRLQKIGNSSPGRPPAAACELGKAGRASWSSHESEEYRDGAWGGSTDGGDSRRSSSSSGGGEVRSSSSGGGDEDVAGLMLWAEARGAGFAALLSPLRAWYLAHGEEVLECCPEGVVGLMAEQPDVMVELMSGGLVRA